MFKRILVPLDRSPGTESVLPALADLASPGATTIRLLHVAPVPTAVMDGTRVVAYADQEGERVRHLAEVYLRTAARRLAGFAVEVTVRFGDPVEEIIREAKECGADLIAMASHRRAGLSRAFHGSVTEAVMRQGPVPVFVFQYGVPAAA